MASRLPRTGPQGQGPRGPRGPQGTPGGPQGTPGGPHGPHGAHGGPMGPNWANVPPLGKTFFRKSTKKSGMSTFGSKTKVVRAEILHILVPIPSRGDLYLTISRVSIILSKFAKMVPSPRPYRSGLVVRPPAWDPGLTQPGVRFDSSCVFQPRCFWGGAMGFSAGKIDLSQN